MALRLTSPLARMRNSSAIFNPLVFSFRAAEIGRVLPSFTEFYRVFRKPISAPNRFFYRIDQRKQTNKTARNRLLFQRLEKMKKKTKKTKQKTTNLRREGGAMSMTSSDEPQSLTSASASDGVGRGGVAAPTSGVDAGVSDSTGQPESRLALRLRATPPTPPPPPPPTPILAAARRRLRGAAPPSSPAFLVARRHRRLASTVVVVVAGGGVETVGGGLASAGAGADRRSSAPASRRTNRYHNLSGSFCSPVVHFRPNDIKIHSKFHK